MTADEGKFRDGPCTLTEADDDDSDRVLLCAGCGRHIPCRRCPDDVQHQTPAIASLEGRAGTSEPLEDTRTCIRDCGDPDVHWRYADAMASLTEARAELERLHSWAGLLSLLDEHWPEDIFPTIADDWRRDTGPRLIAAVRRADSAEAKVARVEALAVWFEQQINWREWGVHRQIRTALTDDAANE